MVAEQKRQRASNGGVRAQSADWVGEYPFASVTVLFGIGVGVGFMLGHTLAETGGRKMFHQDTLTEKLTCQIRDILKNSLPAGVSRYVS